MDKRHTYRTKQRDRILNCLQNHREHVTAEQVREYLKAEGESVGQTTIYRNLDKLVEEGTVLKYASAGGLGACYQYVGQSGHSPDHYHLICTGCGQVIHLECRYLDELSAHIREEHQFSFDKFKTVLYGHCSRCAAENK